MKKIVVFGGSGFLGSYVADELLNRNYDVTIADINKSQNLNDKQKFKKINILNIQDVKKIIKDAYMVYNFSAIAELDEAIENPLSTFQVNVMGNLNILDACKEEGVERIIYASSAYALSSYGSFYGISKQTSEKITEEYYKKYGLKYTVIRYGSLYGDRASNNNSIYKLLKSAIQKGELNFEGDGEELREYIHGIDAAKLSVDILEDKKFENQHIILTGTERLKRKELIIMINEIMGNRLKVRQVDGNNIGHYKITPYSYHPTVGKKLVANPFIDLGQGLLECIQVINKELENKKT